MKKLFAIVVESLALVFGQPLITQYRSEVAAQLQLPSGQFSGTVYAVNAGSAAVAAAGDTGGLAIVPAVGALRLPQPATASSQATTVRQSTAPIPNTDSNPAIVTESGPLKGILVNNVREYLGIPYAARPLGALRWVPPQPFGKWKGLLQAIRFGNFCVQPDGHGGTFGSEDCLSLNIYTPSDNQNNGIPVMVWIHGGGFTTGAGGFYDPTPLVQRGNVIVVTINYRLGPLGIFAHPAIDGEGHINGNYALMDQQFALQWVQRNITAFAGDRNRVTIFGESAGGLSIYSNLASPTAAGLFQGAIAESGAYQSFAGFFPFNQYLNGIVPLTTAEAAGKALATSVGCGSQTAACLRATPATALALAQPGNGFIVPVVDGTVLTQPPGQALALGDFNQVPVITGSNHDEWRLSVADQYDLGVGPLTDAEYSAAVAAFLGLPEANPFVALVLSLYPLTNYPPPPPYEVSAPLALGALGTDVVFACPARNAAQALSQYVTTYAYEFNDENAPSSLPPLSFPLGAAHFTEVQYLFALEEIGIFPTFTPDQLKLSKTMIGYWTEFAKTGDPNFDGAPLWSSYNSATDELQSLVPPAPMAESTFATDHQCAFWDSL